MFIKGGKVGLRSLLFYNLMFLQVLKKNFFGTNGE